MYKAPTLATAAALATSARTLPKRQSVVLCNYYIQNSTILTRRDTSKLFIANKAITVYPRSQLTQDVINATIDNRLLYITKKGEQILAGMQGSMPQESIPESVLKTNIAYFWANVKWESENKKVFPQKKSLCPLQWNLHLGKRRRKKPLRHARKMTPLIPTPLPNRRPSKSFFLNTRADSLLTRSLRKCFWARSPILSTSKFLKKFGKMIERDSANRRGQTDLTDASNPSMMATSAESLSKDSISQESENVNRNFSTNSEMGSHSISTMLEARFGPGVNEYLNTFIKDLNGAKAQSGIGNQNISTNPQRIWRRILINP